ncbi:MAG: hypothetical protein ACJARD_000120 [Alphaproteobacteria bacterium]|jgi:hypothetical protein
MTEAITTTMPFTADFTSFQMNNSHEWAGSTGGSGVKRRDEIEAETLAKDQNYHAGNSDTGLTKAISMGDFSSSYGNTIVTNMARESQQRPNFMNNTMVDSGNMSPSDEAIKISMEGVHTNYSQIPSDLATTPATLPSDLTTYDRLNATAPAYDVGSLTNPNTLGDTLSGLIEKVHSNTQSYEENSDMLANKSKGSAFDRAKDSMISEYDSLSGGLKTKESEQNAIDRQIESYIQVMNSSYEYSLYASGFVDVGKSISQTAQTLTKG